MESPIKLIQNLEKKALEIESLFTEFIKQIPLDYHPHSRGNVIVVGFPDYSWKTLSSELLNKQSDLVGKYRSWYNQSIKIINEFLPDDLSEFKKYYKGDNPPKDYGIIDIMQLNIEVWKSDKSGVIKKFQKKFSSQKNILLTLKHMEFDQPTIIWEEKAKGKKKYSKKIFIIHGHDESMKESVARLLEKLGLEPIILHEQPNEGKTIIEKFEKHSEVGFAIALFSPDDKGFSVKDGEENVKTRARQNVILETGYFFGRLGRNRVIILFKEDENFEFPTDYQGVIYISFDKNEAWKLNIIKEMNSQGYNLDANLLLK